MNLSGGHRVGCPYLPRDDRDRGAVFGAGYPLATVAYAHLIPVIDGGIRIQTTPANAIRGAEWRSHLVAPGRTCMECLGQYTPADVALERSGLLEDPTYIADLDPDHPSALRNIVA